MERSCVNNGLMIQFVIFILFMRSEVGLVMVGFASAEVSKCMSSSSCFLLAMISCLGALLGPSCVLKGLERFWHTSYLSNFDIV